MYFLGKSDVWNIIISYRTISICILIRWGQEIVSKLIFIEIQHGRQNGTKWDIFWGYKMKSSLMKHFRSFSFDEESLSKVNMVAKMAASEPNETNLETIWWNLP